MKIVGLISDTHIPARAKVIPAKVLKIFDDVSLIIHAGDLTQMKIVEDLERLAPIAAVCGNMDDHDVREKLAETRSVSVEGWKILVVHSLGIFTTEQKMKKMTEQNNFHIVVFGHTHRPLVKWQEKTLFINPGSPTNPIPPFIIKPSVGLLKISADKIEPETVKI